jgi:hypothetical protein
MSLDIVTICSHFYFVTVCSGFWLPWYLFYLMKYFRFSGYLQFYWCLRQRDWQDSVSGSNPSSTKSCVTSAYNSSSYYYLSACHCGAIIGTSFQPGQCTVCDIEACSMGSSVPTYITVMSDTGTKTLQVSISWEVLERQQQLYWGPTLDRITVCTKWCCFLQEMFLVKVDYKKHRTSLFLQLGQVVKFVAKQQSWISFSHSLTNYNSQWLSHLSFRCKANTDRHFVIFTNEWLLLWHYHRTLCFLPMYILLSYCLLLCSHTLFLIITNATNGWKFQNKQLLSLATVSTDNPASDYMNLTDCTEYACCQQWKFISCKGQDFNASEALGAALTSTWKFIPELLLLFIFGGQTRDIWASLRLLCMRLYYLTCIQYSNRRGGRCVRITVSRRADWSSSLIFSLSRWDGRGLGFCPCESLWKREILIKA